MNLGSNNKWQVKHRTGSEIMAKKSKIFYGWYIVAGSFLMMTLAWGTSFNTASLFIEPVSESIGISRTSMNFTFTIRSMLQLIISLTSAYIFRRFKLISVLKMSSILVSVTFFMLAYVDSIVSLYVLTAINSTFVVLMGILPLSVLLNNWFYSKIGFVVGLSFMGSGVGGMILNPIAGYLIGNHGWRFTYQVLGVIMLLVLVPVAFFIMKYHPRDVGEYPYGSSEEMEKEKANFNGEIPGLTLSQAVKTPRFWGISIATTLIAIVGISVIMNISPHLTDSGYSIPYAANIVALAMGSLAIGKAILGHLFDRVGLRFTTNVSVLFTIISVLGMLFASNHMALFGIVAGAGMGTAYYTVANPIITAKVYGMKDYSAIYGILTAAVSVGGIMAPIIVGFLYDQSGSYHSSYVLMLALGIISLVMYQFVFPKKENEYK